MPERARYSKREGEQPMPRFAASRVSAVPNAARVQGRVQRVQAEPEGGAVWQLAVAGADDVSGYPNFVRDQVGQTIAVFVPSGTAPAVKAGDSVEAEVTFRGDEHGGRFAVVGSGAGEG